MSARRVHYVLSSHWDREWYQAFQDYRYRLCGMMDHVLAGLEDGRLVGPFTTDGQAIMLEDYLEVHPDRRGEVEALAREGKLVVGPWYVLPDEFLVSGESLVRNLRLGRQVARDFGATPSHAGFVCDLFGHVGQLPQILAGFGIGAGFVWRGVNYVGPKLLGWRSPDGTELLCYRFGMHGYCGYATEVRQAAPGAEAWQPDSPRTDEQIAHNLEAFIQREAQALADGPLILFDGGDHQGWDEQVYQVLRQRMAEPVHDFEIVHSTLDQYLTELQQANLPVDEVITGELREPALHAIDRDNHWLIPGVLSSRVHLKQANVRCQTLLAQWAEPVSVIAHAWLGREYPAGFLNVAWRWLLQNHPHDSICGCSIDRVHQDMVYRFSQCEQIGDRLTLEALQAIGAHVEGDPEGDELRVVLFNPLPEPLDQTLELTLPLPTRWPIFASHGGIMRELMFHIDDDTGVELPVQKLSFRWNRSRFRMFDAGFPQVYKVHEARVSLPVSIPAMGYITLRVRSGQQNQHQRVKLGASLVTGARSMENEHLAVTISAQGTLDVTDKRTGETYRDLLTYEDTADTGDGWYFGQTIGDETYLGGRPVSISLVHDGPFVATFRIRQTMTLPARFDGGDAWHRSSDLREQGIDTLVSLRAGAGHVEVETRMDNEIDDHRLRVLLPSGVKEAATWHADSAFDVVERPIALREDNHLYREPEVEPKPQQSWSAVAHGRRGLAVISEGLHESAVRDWPDRPIALTLYRSTHKTVFTDGEPDGQLRQALRFRFWIKPLAGQVKAAELCRLGQRLASGVKPAYLYAKDIALKRQGERRLPACASFLRVAGDVVVAALEQRQGQAELRLFNPSDESQSVAIHWPGDSGLVPTQCQPVDFEGRLQGQPIAIAAGRCELTVPPRKIMTLRLA